MAYDTLRCEKSQKKEDLYMNNRNGCCNQRRNSCSCRGERIRVGGYDNSFRNDRRNRCSESTYSSRSCERKSCARLRAEERCRNNFRNCMRNARCCDNNCGCGNGRGFSRFEEDFFEYNNDGRSCGCRRSCGRNDYSTFNDGDGYNDEFECCDDDYDDFDSIDQGLYNASLGMAYVPRQRWRCTFRREEGFCRGTVFPELYKPFCPRGGK